MVGEQDSFFGLLNHDLLDFTFFFIGFHEAFLAVDALAADDGKVDIIFF